jgi:hypothetical protein
MRSENHDIAKAMTPQEFEALYPAVIGWIRQTLLSHESSAQTVAWMGFTRLPLYFGRQLLKTTKVVAVDQVPLPPLSLMGLRRFKEFERGDYDGITYLNTFFVKHTHARDEELYFHELIHVIQWRLLGPERFLALYAEGLESFGYHDSPLEKMAYNAQNAFSRSTQTFDAEKLVACLVSQIS